MNESVTEEASSRLAEGLNLSLGSMAEGGSDQDKTTRLQAAFLHYNKGNVAQSQVWECWIVLPVLCSCVAKRFY